MKKNNIVRMYSLLASVSLGVFGVLHLRDRPALGRIELAGAVIFLLTSMAAAFGRTVWLARSIFLLSVLGFLALMLVSGGTAHTGAFWYFAFPVAAFFLTNKRQGIWWMAVLLAMVLTMWLLGMKGILAIAYTPLEIRQLAVSLVVVSIGIFAYQVSREELAEATLVSDQQLHSEKVRADTIVRRIREGVLVTDASGNVTFLNPAAEKVLGRGAGELIGKSYAESVPMLTETGAPLPPNERPLLYSLRTGKPAAGVGQYRLRDGKLLPVAVTSEPVVVNGKVVGCVGTFRDISEEQRIARAKSEFVTLASHQLRTPISAIAWLSELLLNEDLGKLTPEQLEHIRDIYHSNQRMGELVSEMLIVSSLDLGTMPVVPQPLDLADAAKHQVRDQLKTHDGHHHVIEHYDAHLPQVLCDPDVTKLLLRNLVSNALKYTPDVGKVELAITLDPQTKLTPSSQGSVRIEVRDTGYGIPAAAADRIFTKFFRAENITHKDTDGTGLGLYIVKSLLDYVGGRISFTSAEGKGSTFRVWLPLEGMAKHEVKGSSVGQITRRGAMERADTRS